MAAVASPYRFGESTGSFSPLPRRVVLVRALSTVHRAQGFSLSLRGMAAEKDPVTTDAIVYSVRTTWDCVPNCRILPITEREVQWRERLAGESHRERGQARDKRDRDRQRERRCRGGEAVVQ
jgi:hypothetical protein